MCASYYLILWLTEFATYLESDLFQRICLYNKGKTLCLHNNGIMHHCVHNDVMMHILEGFHYFSYLMDMIVVFRLRIRFCVLGIFFLKTTKMLMILQSLMIVTNEMEEFQRGKSFP